MAAVRASGAGGAGVTIPAYLAELRAHLPSTRKSRLLREVEAHLRDATAAHVRAGLDRNAAEARAVAEFGPAAAVAARMRRETAPIAVRHAAAVALVALASLFLPLYAVPENMLPPAPWPERPSYLGVLLTLALVCWLGALALAAVAVCVRPRLAATAIVLAALLGACSGALALAAAVAWHVEAPATPWSVLLIAAPITTMAVLAVFATGAWARERAAALA
jgi:hypothetical protein